MNIPDAFDTFYDKIALPKQPEDRIDSAWNRLKEHIVRHGEVDEEDVSLQGSYPNGTAVRPADPSGEYDVDSYAVVSDGSMTPNDAFEHLESILEESDDYKDRLRKDKDRCLRLEYEDDDIGSFHVDVVAARPHAGGHLEIPIRDGDWRETNPDGFGNWCDEQPEQFGRTVRMLKRWRDVSEEHPGRGVKSIVLQVLVADALPEHENDDATALTETLEGIDARLADHPDRPPKITNPSLESEDLTSTWDDQDYRTFREQVSEAADLAREALDAGTEEASHNLWHELLGDAFPEPPSDPAESSAAVPPPPGYSNPRQSAPRDERYGRH